MIYIFIVLILIFLIFHYDYQGHRKNRKHWFNIILILLILIAGLRYRLGSDTVTYSESFIDNPDLLEYWNFDFESTRFGRAYIFICAIFRTFSENFIPLQFALAIFYNVVILKFFYKNTENVFTAIFLYFITYYLYFNMEILRETCAICVFLLGWKYFVRSDWTKYYIYVGIAILFHPSAAILLFLPLSKLKIMKPFFSLNWFSLLSLAGVYVIGIAISIKFFDLIRLAGIATADNYVDIYENSDFYGGGISLNIKGIIAFIMSKIAYPLFAVSIIYSYRFRNSTLQEAAYKEALVIMLFWYVYILLLSSSIVLLSRFANYFSLFYILGLSDIVFQRIKINKKYLRLSFFTWALFLSPIIYLPISGYFAPSGVNQIPSIHKYYPYSSVLDPTLDREREQIYSLRR